MTLEGAIEYTLVLQAGLAPFVATCREGHMETVVFLTKVHPKVDIVRLPPKDI